MLWLAALVLSRVAAVWGRQERRRRQRQAAGAAGGTATAVAAVGAGGSAGTGPGRDGGSSGRGRGQGQGQAGWAAGVEQRLGQRRQQRPTGGAGAAVRAGVAVGAGRSNGTASTRLGQQPRRGRRDLVLARLASLSAATCAACAPTAQGIILLAVSSALPDPDPDSDTAPPLQFTLIFTSLAIISLGTGGIKPNVSAFGADQFSEADPQDRKEKESFFNWCAGCAPRGRSRGGRPTAGRVAALASRAGAGGPQEGLAATVSTHTPTLGCNAGCSRISRETCPRRFYLAINVGSLFASTVIVYIQVCDRVGRAQDHGGKGRCLAGVEPLERGMERGSACQNVRRTRSAGRWASPSPAAPWRWPFSSFGRAAPATGAVWVGGDLPRLCLACRWDSTRELGWRGGVA